MRKGLRVKQIPYLYATPCIGSVILILFVSLTYSHTFSDGITTAKEVAFIIGTGITLLVTALLLFFRKPVTVFRLNYIDVVAIAFLLYELILYLFYKKTDISIPVLPLIVACTLLLYILVSASLRTKGAVTRIVYTFFVLTGVLHLVVGYLQYSGVLKSFHFFFPVTGMFFNPGPFAIYLSVIMVMCFAGWLKFLYEKKYRIVLFLSLVIGAGGLLLFILKSRSALIGLSCGMLFVTVLYLKRNKPDFFRIHKNKITRLVIVILPLFCWLAFIIYRMKEESAIGRLLTWQVSMDIVKNNLFTGVGPSNFPVAYFQYQHNRFELDKTFVTRFGNLAGESAFAFNDLLQITCEGGVIALLLFLILLFMIFSNGIRAFRETNIPDLAEEDSGYKQLLLLSALGGIVALMAAGIFSYPLSVLPLNLLFWLLVSCVSSACSFAYWRSVVILPIKLRLIACVSLLPALFVIAAGSRRTKAFLQWNKIENKSMEVSSLTNVPEQLAGLLPVLGDNGEYQLTLGLMLLANKQHIKAIEVLQKAKKLTNNKMVYYCLGKAFEMKGDYVAAETQYRFVATAMPSLLRPYYLMAKMYYTKKAYEPFYSNAAKVMDFNPKISTMETEKMKSEIAMLIYEMKRNKE